MIYHEEGAAICYFLSRSDLAEVLHNTVSTHPMCLPTVLLIFFLHSLKSWKFESWAVHSICVLDFGLSLILSVCVDISDTIQRCGWIEWPVCFGYPMSCVFFVYLLVISARTNILSFKRAMSLPEQHGGAYKGRGSSYGSWTQEWPPTVTFSSSSESWWYSNIGSGTLPLW